ncbi:MAG TPA: alpha-ketoglutarate-dependent dioxygenase AlkB [Gammaproteobacteria bacterium]|jgi:alkylated DNA repair dioxygenase AlkB|nr:alpha-ketoglutarate-dependent dioxygenase AlkB [Acidiferrobacteraceae bacterium]MDP6398630.1 alpha-ketoglutarate-dependent dioxygenase AlkB [Arenicellales bacterium]MDP6552825.1 alpha-ketoglutarate-dependent dioxygenase AlkB [Arenicellales bacterium]MDP6918921.1 alpha-ketoglutarate-dependent dioxygenase AlkB [Arenicellales bacterium]HCX87158.1 alpha-ketoglutarate-dependent dioxygenase AlkB [Gammaproteobacteria bacterium]|tara:strand:+ start:353 stop:1006 length:654 start_codon:yes stop_codon:yes gene_type:complete
MSQSEIRRRGTDLVTGEGQLAVEDGIFEYWPRFLDAAEASSCLEQLQERIDWHTPRVFVYGRWVDSPRQSAWYGDSGAVYRYSGTVNQPSPWLPELDSLRERLKQFCTSHFNSVLANQYRSGRDSIGWHSDDEKELGPDPVIASVSLGGARRFLLQHRRRKHLPIHEIVLEHGSLLVMGAGSQRAWRHSVPKTRRPVAPRINLTYRHVIAATDTTTA